MFPLDLLPDQKLDLYLWKERLDSPLPEIRLSIKCKAILVVALLPENFL